MRNREQRVTQDGVLLTKLLFNRSCWHGTRCTSATKCDLEHRNYDAHAVGKYDSRPSQRKERGILVGRKEVEWLSRQNGLKCCWVAGKRRFRTKFCATAQPTRQRQHEKDRRVGFGNNFCWGKRPSSNDDEYDSKRFDSITVDRNKRTVDSLTGHRTTDCCKTMRDTRSLSRLLYFVLDCMCWSTLPLHIQTTSPPYIQDCVLDKGQRRTLATSRNRHTIHSLRSNHPWRLLPRFMWHHKTRCVSCNISP